MGPVIILDKSTLQSLSNDELLFLNKYFILNIPPVLIMEIWGDLAKPDKEGAISKDQVQHLAQKVYRGQSAINAHFFHCLVGSLLGEKISMDGRILLPGGSPRITKSGKKGVIFKETPEEKQLNRWKFGDFNSEEESIAAQWRTASKVIDLEVVQTNFAKKFKSIVRIDSLASLDSFVNNYFTRSLSQTDFLSQLIEEYKIPQVIASKIFLRYERANRPTLNTFAPYAYYCLRIKTFFLFALIYNLVSSRKTNIIDLEYLYYLPFCMAFSSSDKFHQILVPYSIRGDQRFVPGIDLKTDLTHLARDWNVNFHKDMKAWNAKYGNGPPENANSVVYRLWRELFPHWKPGANRDSSESEPGKNKKLYEELEEFEKARTLQETDSPTDDSKVDFIIHKYSLSIHDPCPCGSGKKLKDCHWPEIKNSQKRDNISN
jgi:hypothetical protein